MKKKALIVWGGWDGHEPDQVAERDVGVDEVQSPLWRRGRSDHRCAATRRDP